MVEHQRVITKVYFPRLLLPMAAVCLRTGGSGHRNLSCSLECLLYYGIAPGSRSPAAAIFPAISRAHCAGRGAMAFGASTRFIAMCATSLPFLVQFLDVRLARRLSLEPRSGALALALQLEFP